MNKKVIDWDIDNIRNSRSRSRRRWHDQITNFGKKMHKKRRKKKDPMLFISTFRAYPCISMRTNTKVVFWKTVQGLPVSCNIWPIDFSKLHFQFITRTRYWLDVSVLKALRTTPYYPICFYLRKVGGDYTIPKSRAIYRGKRGPRGNNVFHYKAPKLY